MTDGKRSGRTPDREVGEPTSPVFTSLGLAFGMAIGELALAVGSEGDVELALRQAEIAAKATLLSAPSRASGVF